MSDRMAVYPDGSKPQVPYSPAIKAGGWVFVSGQLASHFETGLVPEATGDGENAWLRNRQALQGRVVLENLKRTLAASGCDIASDVMRSYQWWVSPHPTIEAFEAGNHNARISMAPYLDVQNEYFQSRPPSTAVGVRELMVKDCLIEVNLIAFEPNPEVGPSLIFEDSEDDAAPLAAHSSAIRRGDWVFLSGGPENGLHRDSVWDEKSSTLEGQVDSTLRRLAAMAERAGSSLERAVKATVYMGHPQDFAGIDNVWRHWFPEDPPARVVIPFTGLSRQGARVQIAFKLLAYDSDLTIETIEASKVPPQMGHEPHAVKVGKFLFFSTQLPIDSKANLAASAMAHANFPYYVQPPKLQMRYILDNVSEICDAAGTSLDQIVNRQFFQDDFSHFASAMEEWVAHFPNDPPASTTVRLGGPLQVEGAHVLLDLIGYVPD